MLHNFSLPIPISGAITIHMEPVNKQVKQLAHKLRR